MASLGLRLLGSFEVWVGSESAIVLPTQKTKLLLAYLAMPPGEPHSRDKLSGLLWSDRGDEQSHRSLRHALSVLRKEFAGTDPPPLVATRGVISLEPAAVNVDAVTFENLVAAGTHEDLGKACTLYRGDLLEDATIRDPPFEEWLFYERQRLRDLALRAFEQLLDYERKAGDYERAIETAHRLLALHPTHEQTHRTLMQVYADQGRRAAALNQYQECRVALERELGVKPEPETEQVYQAICQERTRPSPSPEGTLDDTSPEKEQPAVPSDMRRPESQPPSFVPAIAVLPFENLSADPGQEYFVDGITEEIITDLSRFRNLFVIARHSVFTYKGKPVTVQQVGSELGVQYVLEGSVQRLGKRLRITAQLADATTGHEHWAERYDRDLTDIFAVQDDVSQKIVATVASWHTAQTGRTVREHVKRQTTDNLAAYEYYLLNLEHMLRFTKQDNCIARQMLEKAVELDPNFARAHASLAIAHNFDWWFEWSDSPAESQRRASDSARKAVALDPSDGFSHWALGIVSVSSERHEQGSLEFEKAISLNPNHADVLASWGWALSYLGRAEEGIEFIKKAMGLNPYHPDWYVWASGVADFSARRYEKAIAALQGVQHHTVESRAYLAASHAQVGHGDEAKAEAAKVLEIDPRFSLAGWIEKKPFKNPADLAHYVEGMRKAGLPK